MSEQKRKTNKTNKQLRTIRNTVMMALVCVLLLSTATYAWFSVSNTAKVTNLTMTVGSESGIEIAPDTARDGAGAAGEYGIKLEFVDADDDGLKATDYSVKKALLPATMLKADNTIQKPVYTDGEVTAVEAVGDGTSGTKNEILKDSTTADGRYYYYTTTFYLRTSGEDDVQVELAESDLDGIGTWVLESGMSSLDDVSGTYLLNLLENDTNKDTQVGAAAVRIRLSVEGDDTSEIIYQPLADFTPTSNLTLATDSRADAATAGVEPTDVQNMDGTFDTTTATKGSLTISPSGTRVTMELWLEGTDPCCGDEIMAQQIIAQLTFQIKEDTATAP